MEELNIKKIGFLIAGAIGILMLAVFGGNLFETNDAGQWQVRQAAITGDLSVRNQPGTYWQGLGKIETYPLSPTLAFTSGSQGSGSGEGADDIDLGGDSFVDTPFAVTFMGNSTANVSGVIKVRLPGDRERQLSLHNLYRNKESIVDTLVRQTVGEAVKLAGPMFSAEEARTTKREEYTRLVLNMIQEGLYETYTTTEKYTDEAGNIRNTAVTRLTKDASGKPKIVKVSPFKQFGIEVVQFTVRGLEFDKVTQDLMMAKKTAEQKKIVARADAEKAKQDALTEIEKGKATVAKAQAEENEKKIRQVVKAQADFESAQYQRKQAEEVAKAKEVEGRAEAVVAQLKVRAGLSPLEAAEIDMKTKIGIAKELANTQFPTSMVIVGGGKGTNGSSNVNPFDAIGIKAMYDLSNQMANDHPGKAKAAE